MALTNKQKARLAGSLGRIGQALAKAAAAKKKNQQQNGNLSGCGGCTRQEGQDK